LRVAAVVETPVAGLVVALGTAGAVVKVMLPPLVVPELFVATILKSYVVFGVSPVGLADSATALVPDPALPGVVGI
jgi:hypothetical protein